MSTILRTISVWHCDRCHHEWYSPQKPRCCAKCKCRKWDKTKTANGSDQSLPQVAEPVQVDEESRKSDSPTREELRQPQSQAYEPAPNAIMPHELMMIGNQFYVRR